MSAGRILADRAKIRTLEGSLSAAGFANTSRRVPSHSGDARELRVQLIEKIDFMSIFAAASSSRMSESERASGDPEALYPYLGTGLRRKFSRFSCLSIGTTPVAGCSARAVCRSSRVWSCEGATRAIPEGTNLMSLINSGFSRRLLSFVRTRRESWNPKGWSSDRRIITLGSSLFLFVELVTLGAAFGGRINAVNFFFAAFA